MNWTALLVALTLPACSGTIETAGPDAPPCDPNTITVRLVRADLTPYTLDAYSACSAPDAPELYGRVWCCPAALGEGGAA